MWSATNRGITRRRDLGHHRPALDELDVASGITLSLIAPRIANFSERTLPIYLELRKRFQQAKDREYGLGDTGGRLINSRPTKRAGACR